MIHAIEYLFNHHDLNKINKYNFFFYFIFLLSIGLKIHILSRYSSVPHFNIWSANTDGDALVSWYYKDKVS